MRLQWNVALSHAIGRAVNDASQQLTGNRGIANCADRKVLPVRAADRRSRSTWNAKTDDENDHQYRGSSRRGARKEFDEDVIESHNEEYGSDQRFQRGYDQAWPKVRDES